VVPTEISQLLGVLIYPGFLFILFLAFFYEWFDRKIVARLQNRYGPLYAGPAGILQPLADFIKLLAKEDINPKAADKITFAVTPILMLALALSTLLFIPTGNVTAISWFDGDLIFVAFLISILVLVTLIAAWSSTSKFSTVGGVRVALQMLGFEIPMMVVMMGPALMAKTLSITQIAQWQNSTGHYFALFQPIGLAILIICLLAEVKKAPFDIPEAESELAAGWQTEFSGRKLALIRLTTDVEIILASALVTALYLGGPNGPFGIPPVIYFLIKITVVVFILSNLRALFARFRIDQMLSGSWKYLLPLALLQIILVIQGVG
jgi:NADH-quinone oxidoreductase subunit H